MKMAPFSLMAVIEHAPSMTWKFVIARPSSETKKAVPFRSRRSELPPMVRISKMAGFGFFSILEKGSPLSKRLVDSNKVRVSRNAFSGLIFAPLVVFKVGVGLHLNRRHTRRAFH